MVERGGTPIFYTLLNKLPMRLNRNFVTPVLTVIFVMVALTGMLMFFHLFDGYTEVVHEILGLFLVVCTILHIILNWKALKIHFKKKVFLPAALNLGVISLLFVVQQHFYPKTDTILYEKITTAPLEDAYKVLRVDAVEVTRRLEEQGIATEGAASVEEIWRRNRVSPNKVFNLLMQ